MKTPFVTQVTSLNVTLIVLGLVILAFGLHRIIPIRLDKAFWLQNGLLGISFCIGIYFLRRAHWPGATAQLMAGTIAFGGRFLPLMIILCFVMALGGILGKAYHDTIVKLLRSHQILAPLIGSFFTPTPNTPLTMIEEMWHDVTLRPMFIYFLQAASLMSLPLFALRKLGFTNPEISTKMYIAGFIVSIAVFPFRYVLYNLTDWIYWIYMTCRTALFG